MTFPSEIVHACRRGGFACPVRGETRGMVHRSFGFHVGVDRESRRLYRKQVYGETLGARGSNGLDLTVVLDNRSCLRFVILMAVKNGMGERLVVGLRRYTYIEQVSGFGGCARVYFWMITCSFTQGHW